MAGRIGEDEEAGYVVHYGVDRGWWGNLRENLPGEVFSPASKDAVLADASRNINRARAKMGVAALP